MCATALCKIELTRNLRLFCMVDRAAKPRRHTTIRYIEGTFIPELIQINEDLDLFGLAFLDFFMPRR
jgi:hypothetical protein